MPLAICPACDEDVRIGGRARIGQTMTCVHCGARLEVVEVEPIELDWAYDDDEELEEESAPGLPLEDEADDTEDFGELILDEELVDADELDALADDDEDMDDGEE